MINIITKSDNIYKFDIICKSLYLIKNIKQDKIILNIKDDKEKISEYIVKILKIYCNDIEIIFFKNDNLEQIYKKDYINVIFYNEKSLKNLNLLVIDLDKFNYDYYDREYQIEGIKYLYSKLQNL